MMIRFIAVHLTKYIQTGPLNDADPDDGVYDGINSFGHYRYGSYGLNVGIGNIDDDSDLEIIGTYDNHQIQAFKVLHKKQNKTNH